MTSEHGPASELRDANLEDVIGNGLTALGWEWDNAPPDVPPDDLVAAIVGLVRPVADRWEQAATEAKAERDELCRMYDDLCSAMSRTGDRLAEAMAETERVREQLRLANIDATTTAAELDEERQCAVALRRELEGVRRQLHMVHIDRQRIADELYASCICDPNPESPNVGPLIDCPVDGEPEWRPLALKTAIERVREVVDAGCGTVRDPRATLFHLGQQDMASRVRVFLPAALGQPPAEERKEEPSGAVHELRQEWFGDDYWRPAGGSEPEKDSYPADPWLCPRCGSSRWVATSLTGPGEHGGRAIRQCVLCGYYSNDPAAPDPAGGSKKEDPK